MEETRVLLSSKDSQQAWKIVAADLGGLNLSQVWWVADMGVKILLAVKNYKMITNQRKLLKIKKKDW